MGAESHWQHGISRASVGRGALPGDTDVVVVGGGLLGACCAYWLARRGRQVLLLERHDIASGATGRNAGFVVPTTAPPYPYAVREYGAEIARAVRQLAVDGTQLLARVVADEGIASDHRARGSIHLALNDTQAAESRHEVDLSRADGFDESWLDRRELAELIGTPLGGRIVGGRMVSGALTNSVALVDGIVAAACRLGAVVRTGVPVGSVRTAPAGVVADTSAGPVRATAAVIATNAWLGELVPRLSGVVHPVQGQVIATPPMPAMFPYGMSAPVTATGVYWQQTPDGTIILGGCRAVADAPAEPAAQVPQPAVHRALLDVLPGLFPALGPVSAVRGWAGAMAFTPDQLPVVDEIDESVWAIGGFNGHGMPFGAVVADLVADWIHTATRPPALAPLTPDRFPSGAHTS